MDGKARLFRQLLRITLVLVGIPLLLLGGSMVYIGVYALAGPLEPVQATVLSMEPNERDSAVVIGYSYMVGDREYQSSTLVDASESKAMFVGDQMGIFVSNNSPWFSSNEIPSKRKIIIFGLSSTMLGLLLILRVVMRRKPLKTLST
jgi:hypothetical protein